MTLESFVATIMPGAQPPAELSAELRALWHAKAGEWDAAHDIAQEIPSPTGSWIHGLLHAIEGDFGNSAYWYHRAGQPPIRAGQIDAEWSRIAASLLVGA
ncbi:MAG TPA: hypothetical protein PLA50_01075 [Bacteroidia bacterium]|nr:hypothetical protein [Bacteroidia bacterium]